MILGVRFLSGVCDANSFEFAPAAQFAEGDTPQVYLQLTDAGKLRAADGWKPSGLRYAPAAGATLVAVVGNIDDARKITRTCTQPFPGDASVWQVPMTSSDLVRGTQTLRLTLTEGSVVHKLVLNGAFRVSASSEV